MVKERLSFWSTDKIVATGLVIMGIIAVTGTIFHMYATGNNNGSEVPMAIVSGLTGFLGRGALNGDLNIKSHSQENKDADSKIPPEGLEGVKGELDGKVKTKKV